MQNLGKLLPSQNPKIEKEMLEKGVTKTRRQIESARNRDSESETKYGQRLLREGIPELVKGIKEWFKEQEKAPIAGNAYYKLRDIDPRVTAFIALKSVLDCLMQRRPLASSAIRLGALIEDEMHFGAFSEHPQWSQILRGAKKRPNYKKRRYYLIHSEKGEASKGQADEWEKWGTRIKLHIGTVLITLIKDYTGLLDYVMIQTDKRGPARFIQATKKTQQWIEDMIAHNEMLEPFWMPLKDYPKQWKDKWSGGYDVENGLPPLPLIKTRNKSFLRINEEPMTDIMSCLNSLQNTPWRINHRVLDTLKTFWDEGVPIGSLPAREDEVLPPFPADESDEIAKTIWKRKAAQIYDYNSATKSRRLLVLNTIGLANKYKNNRFYLPHQCDFRGRAYAVPAYVNHMGADFAKALLHFDRGIRATTDDQLKWLFIHGANCFGFKGTYTQRIDWVIENTKQIDQLATNPLSALDFLNEADETFQFLAFAYEFQRLHKEGSKFSTHLPCQMDASNNGLQILGMLTRDESSCIATNVAPTNYPEDIYGIVAEKACEYLRAEAGSNPFANQWLTFGVNRSASKRPTMTQPYGSTPHSARSYVNQWYLEKVRGGADDPFDESNRFQATAYLSSKIWEAINQVVGKPREAMAWLQGTARTLAKFERPFYWVSPSGFPCNQAYQKWEQKSIRTKIGDKVLRVKFREDIDKMSPKRQAQGSSPNFVHSLDASCLHMTVNKCEQLGIKDFAMVHDSYGTHSVNCEAMANQIRHTLVEIFEQDQLAILKNNLEEANDLTLPELPCYGSFNIKDIINSKYIFS